ncbi:MAG: extracellular solute-binding protein [Candidatus Rokubacteria bacterium]|nr:extracellular solute-binding protein [Candidatus Rokubacteria bacterium]MBI3827355.1 extracellular solute-binding protein [Candidatus Rokubacteria bacterium]
MSDHEKDYLLQCFATDVPRRRVLKGLVAAGAGLATLTRFADHLAAAPADEAAELTIFAWPGLVPDILKERSVAPFNRTYPKVNVKLDISTNATMYPKMLASKANPVISGGMFNDVFVQRGMGDGLWVKPNDEWMPHRKEIPPDIMPPGGYGTIFQQTPFGLMYNPDKVEKPRSWADLWDPKYKGRVEMWDIYFDAYIAAAVMSGKGPSVEEGIKLWAPHRQNIGAWTMSPTKVEDDVSRGEMWLAPHWGSWAEQARSQGKKVAFTIPKEGAVQWGGHMVTVAGFSPKVTELTQRYLDTWNSEECQLGWVTKGFFGPANRKVKIPAEMLKLEAMMTAEDAAKKLIRYDVKAVGERMTKLKAMIDQTLKV